MSTLQIIYTLDATPSQYIANVPLHIIDISSKTKAIKGLKILLCGKFCFIDDSWKKQLIRNTFHIPENVPNIPTLVKVSMCIIGEENNNIPYWYTKANGKIYFN